MTIKICFNNQTHRISKHPADFTGLIQKVSEIFGNQLPQSWTLQYLDSDEDKIMLNSHEDYKTLLEEEVGSSNKSVKIFVLPLEEGQSKVDLSAMLESQKKESVEIIEKPILEAIEEPAVVAEKVEEVQEIEREEVVQEEKIESVVEEQPKVEAVIEEEKPKVEEVPVQSEQEAKPEVPIHPLQKILVNFLRPKELIANHKEKIQVKLAKVMTAEKLQKIQEKKQKFLQRAAEKQAKKKNELRDAVTDIIYEQLPIIASLTKEFIQDGQISTEPRQRQVPPKAEAESPAVHRIVRCDGCRAFPIVGIRYKCYTCPDFDYCEKCEATKEHPHPFIKFKKPQERERGHCPMNRGPMFGRAHPFHRQPQAQPEMRDFPFGPFGFMRCMKKMNEEMNGQQQQAQAQPEVQKTEVNKPQEAEPVLIKAEVVIEEVKPEEIKKEEEIIKEKKEEEIVKEEKKEYDAKTLEKAERLKEVFGDLDMEHVLEFISQVSDLSLEDLIGSYQGF